MIHVKYSLQKPLLEKSEGIFINGIYFPIGYFSEDSIKLDL